MPTGLRTNGIETSSIGQKVYSPEIIDLSKKGNNECENWDDFPLHDTSLIGQTGGLLGKIPIICGGNNNDYGSSCLIYKDKWTVHVRLSVRRVNAASLVLNETILWITGGESSFFNFYGSGYISNTSDFIGIEAGSQPGPDLPLGFIKHSMIGINSTLSMIIGGYHHYSELKCSPLTFWFYHGESKWVEAPSLNHGRQEHANGIAVDQVTKEKLVIVTGGFTEKQSVTNSTEVLIENQWMEGTNHYIQNQNQDFDKLVSKPFKV